ncbi:MAG: hypothetical protein ABIN10_07550 [Specibacter sp.]
MTTQKTTAGKLPGDVLIRIGPVAVAIGFFLAFMTAGSASGLAVILTLTIGGLLLVVIGYLKRISHALANKP